MRQVPRIARRLHRGIFSGRTHGELVQIGFAEWDCSSSAQFSNDGGVVSGAITLQNPRPASARLTHHIDDVFNRKWDAAQWKIDIHFLHFSSGSIYVESEISTDFSVNGFNALSQSIDDFARGDLSATQ